MAILVTYSTTILIWFLFISHSSFNHFIIIASANIAVNERCKQSKMIQPIAGMGMHAVWLTHDDVLAWAGRPAGRPVYIYIASYSYMHYTLYRLYIVVHSHILPSKQDNHTSKAGSHQPPPCDYLLCGVAMWPNYLVYC